jgi:L-asparaginase/Glu-tRNA(Gln) amidotransferase subunit D
MAETARFLKKNLNNTQKTIILTGSLTPITFDNSDAEFNIKFAIEEARILNPGIYVLMNGDTFSPEEAAKDEATGKFYSIYKNKK